MKKFIAIVTQILPVVNYMKNPIAVVILGLSVGYFGSMIAESGDHQERHIQQIESRY